MQPATRNTLYTELGIKESATREEVKAAYWQRAKEIHPDKAGNDEERALAEEKMSHLNDVMAVLGGDETRAEYDAELKRQRDAEAADLRKVSVAASLQAWRGKQDNASRKHWPIYAGAALAALVAAWVALVLMSDSRETQWWQSRARQQASSSAPASTPEPKSPVTPQVIPPVEAEAPRARQPAPAESHPANPVPAGPPENNFVSPLIEEARRALEKKRETAPVSVPPAPPPTVVSPPAPATPSGSPPVAASAHSNPWNGSWRYASNLGGGLGGAYLPLSIEMQMNTSGKKVRGIYRARYQVARRKYSERVEFTFEGWSDSGDRLKGVWQDSTGGRGEFEIKAVDSKILEMNWWTTAFGRKGSLASGVARLAERAN